VRPVFKLSSTFLICGEVVRIADLPSTCCLNLTDVPLWNGKQPNYNGTGAGQTVAGSISCRLGGRKVRTPQGGVPRNAGGS